MEVVKSPVSAAKKSGAWRGSGLKVGLVPTMGALHAGHLSLVKRARRECDKVVLSIYVNPTQFGPTEDLSRYPRPRRMDLALCRKAGVDLVFAPSSLYFPDHSTWVDELAEAQGQEGVQRPGHFRGVATVVLILFNIVQANRAYFGQKDGQQVRVIQRMVRDLYLPLKVVVCPTIREKDGLAMSSRNRYLSAEERVKAGQFAALLEEASGLKSGDPVQWLIEKLGIIEGLKVDYCEVTGNRLVAAVRLGKTRLLDNRAILT